MPLHCEDGRAIAFARGDGEGQAVVVVACRARADRPSGPVPVPAGDWTDALTGSAIGVGPDGLELGELLAERPVALLVRSDLVRPDSLSGGEQS